jgi:hypothetical protein
VIIDGVAEASDQPGPRATDGANQERVLDLHADLDVPSLSLESEGPADHKAEDYEKM